MNDKKLEQILNNFSSIPYFTTNEGLRMTKKLLRQGTVFHRGQLLDIKARHLGSGIYKIMAEPRRKVSK